MLSFNGTAEHEEWNWPQSNSTGVWSRHGRPQSHPVFYCGHRGWSVSWQKKTEKSWCAAVSLQQISSRVGDAPPLESDGKFFVFKKTDFCINRPAWLHEMIVPLHSQSSSFIVASTAHRTSRARVPLCCSCQSRVWRRVRPPPRGPCSAACSGPRAVCRTGPSYSPCGPSSRARTARAQPLCGAPGCTRDTPSPSLLQDQTHRIRCGSFLNTEKSRRGLAKSTALMTEQYRHVGLYHTKISYEWSHHKCSLAELSSYEYYRLVKSQEIKIAL